LRYDFKQQNQNAGIKTLSKYTKLDYDVIFSSRWPAGDVMAWPRLTWTSLRMTRKM